MWIRMISLLLLSPSLCLAVPLTIDIKKGVVAQIPLAFLGIEGQDSLSSVIANDLVLSGSFQILSEKSLQTAQQAFNGPQFWPWQNHEGSFLITGIAKNEGEVLHVTMRLFDIRMGKMIGEASIRENRSQWRKMAHLIANALYERLTGEKGYFHTSIVYTAQYGSPIHKKQRIAMIDQDGANGRFLTPETRKSLLPRSAFPFITFTAFHGFKSYIHLYNLASGKDKILSFPGIALGSRFTPQRDALVVAAAHGGKNSFFHYSLKQKEITSLSSSKGFIDVSPSYHPDGKAFVFSSDRYKGKCKLFVTYPGQAPRLLSQGDGRYLAPVWSPDGQWIAFVKQSKGKYYLGVMRFNGEEERLLACDHVIDHPSWAPNSRLLIFSAQQKRYGPFSLYIADLTGRSLRKLVTACQGVAHEGNHPDWMIP